MASKKSQQPDPWERLPDESQEAYEAFKTYRDLEGKRSQARVGEKLGKSDTILSRWSADYNWVERVKAWDAEADRRAAEKMLREIANTRVRQRNQAIKMQEKAMELLTSINIGDAKLSEIVSLLKAGMEQERIVIGDVGEVIEERNGGDAMPAVQIYVPDNNRGKKDDFDDLKV